MRVNYKELVKPKLTLELHPRKVSLINVLELFLELDVDEQSHLCISIYLAFIMFSCTDFIILLISL